jgi:hypothetical protein
METEIEKILLEHLKETLKQFQNYLVWGLVAILSYYLLVINKSNITNINLPVIGSFDSIDKSLASMICISVFFFLGAMATYALERVDRICLTFAYVDKTKIQDDSELIALFENKTKLLQATLTFPSIATENKWLIRIAPMIISIVLIVLARIEIWNSASSFSTQLLILSILLSPFITITVLLLNSWYLTHIPKPDRIKISR